MSQESSSIFMLQRIMDDCRILTPETMEKPRKNLAPEDDGGDVLGTLNDDLKRLWSVCASAVRRHERLRAELAVDIQSMDEMEYGPEKVAARRAIDTQLDPVYQYRQAVERVFVAALYYHFPQIEETYERINFVVFGDYEIMVFGC